MKVYVAHDGALRVRIGDENLGSESLGPWYGGTGAIRLRQVLGTWFWAYRLDDHGYRGAGALPETEFPRVREHIPSARIVEAHGTNLDVRVSEADLRMLRERVVPLSTRVARFGEGVVAMFGDFEVPCLAGARLGLFHLGGGRFNGFRVGFHYTALGDDDMPRIDVHFPSARLLREGPRTIIEMGDADLTRLLGMAEEA